MPSTKPGARKAALGGVFSFAPYSTVRTFGHAYSISIGPEVLAEKPLKPTALTKSPPSAVSVPSARAPATRRWIVPLRLPRRGSPRAELLKQRTAWPVRLASSAAT